MSRDTLHIAYVCPEYPLGTSANGVSTYTSRMVDGLLPRGHSVTTFCLNARDDSRPADAKNVRIRHVLPGGIRVPVLRTLYYRLAHRLFDGYLPYRDLGVGLREAVCRAHAEVPIDVLQCPEWGGLAWWLRSLGIPLVVRLHCPLAVSCPADGMAFSRSLRSVTALERRSIEIAGGVTAPSRAMVEVTEQTLGVSLPDARVIPNPIVVDEATTGESESRGATPVLFVGRMDGLKGFDGLVHAFAKLASDPRHAGLVLDVVGPDSGVLGTDGRRMSGATYLARHISDSALRDRVRLLGRRPQQEVQQRRWAGRVVVVPSRFENFPNTALEAMAAGCAVVASDAGGIPELIQHERNGLLFKSEDWADFARQLDRALCDDELRTQLGATAQADVAKRYAPPRITSETEAMYRAVMAGGSCQRMVSEV